MLKTKITVAYLRLSIEDGDDRESASIGNQRKIIEEYARKHNLKISEVYIDDGYSGYTMSRPDFNRLKNDLNNGKIDTIIVKDLSRLGRHNAKVQLFLENILESGKRVIALGDPYDTFDKSTHKMVGITTWVNELYIVDTSQKIKASIESMQKNGQYISMVPYGYIKDYNDKKKYYVDPLTAPYVKQIFDMYINGMGIKLIARELTEKNIPSPSMIRKQQTEARGNISKRKVSNRWDVKAIQQMLKNEFYIGTLVLGKSKCRSINGKQIPISPDDWIKFPDAHEAIIDKHTFNLVQEITKSRSFGNYRGKKIQTRANIFAGLLYCADCGSRMTSANGGDNTRYICRAYNVYGTSICTSHSINEATLTKSILEFLEYCKKNLSNVLQDIDKIIQAEMSSRTHNNGDVQELINRLEKAQQSIKILIEQKTYETIKNPEMIDIINKTYNDIQNEKYQEIKSLEKQIEDMRVLEIDEVSVKQNLNCAIRIIDDAIDSNKLTKKQVLMLIDKICVHEDGGLDIYLKGDLHELCNNYFKIGDAKICKIKELLYNFILQDTNKIVTRDAAAYIRKNGVKLTFESLSKIVKEELLQQNIIARNPMNRGYRLIGDIKDLERVLLSNNFEGYTRWLSNDVVIKVMASLSKWIQSMEYKKKLF